MNIGKKRKKEDKKYTKLYIDCILTEEYSDDGKHIIGIYPKQICDVQDFIDMSNRYNDDTDVIFFKGIKC